MAQSYNPCPYQRHAELAKHLARSGQLLAAIAQLRARSLGTGVPQDDAGTGLFKLLYLKVLLLTLLSHRCIVFRQRQYFLGRQLSRECQVEKTDHHFIETLLSPDDRLRRVWILRIVS